MLLGAIKEIRDYELRVNLPNNIIGCVSITNMADGYTGLLKRFAQTSDDNFVAEVCHLLSPIAWHLYTTLKPFLDFDSDGDLSSKIEFVNNIGVRCTYLNVDPLYIEPT